MLCCGVDGLNFEAFGYAQDLGGSDMTMGEMWGWMEAFYRNIGIWDTMSSALGIVVIVSLGLWGLRKISG